MNLMPADIKSGKILVIYDNPIIQRTIYFALRDKGYAVLMSGDISGALEIVRQEPLDAILLDIIPRRKPPSVPTPCATVSGRWTGCSGWMRPRGSRSSSSPATYPKSPRRMPWLPEPLPIFKSPWTSRRLSSPSPNCSPTNPPRQPFKPPLDKAGELLV